MKPTTRLLSTILVHIGFWSFVTFVFLRNSFLRPVAESVWTECAILLIVVASFYLSYFVLVPKLLLRRCFLLFFFCSLLLIMLGGTIELWVMKRDMMVVFDRIFMPNEIPRILWITFFFICLRNACFIIVGDIAKLCELQAIQLQQNNKVTIEITGHILVNIPSKLTALLDISEICYLKYSNRKTTIYRHSSYPVATYTSLNYFEENLPVHQFIRINRNVLVAYSAIQYYNDEAVFVLSQKTMVSFSFCNSNSENTLAQLKQWDLSKYHPLNSLTQNNL